MWRGCSPQASTCRSSSSKAIKARTRSASPLMPGKLHGACWAWETLKVAWANAIPAGEVNVVLQVTAKKIPELTSVPMALELAKTEEARMLLKAGAIDPAAIVR